MSKRKEAKAGKVGPRKAAVAKAGKNARSKKVAIPVVVEATGIKKICVACKAKSEKNCAKCVVTRIVTVVCKECRHRRIDKTCCKTGQYVSKKNTCEYAVARA